MTDELNNAHAWKQASSLISVETLENISKLFLDQCLAHGIQQPIPKLLCFFSMKYLCSRIVLIYLPEPHLLGQKNINSFLGTLA